MSDLKMQGNEERGNEFRRGGAQIVLNPIPCPRRRTLGASPHSAGLQSHVLSVLLTLCLLLPPVQAAPALPARQLALDKILNAPALKGGVTGAIVCRVSDGQVLYTHDADLRLMPASNRKLFTSAAALELLGPDFRAHTDILTAAKPDADGTIKGSLFLRGGGDGLLSPADLDALADTLAKSGVKRIEGGVVGDGSRFTDGPYGFGWEWDDFSDEEFPQISALEVNQGVLKVHLSPGAQIGDPVTASVDPPTDYVPLVISAKTGAKEAVTDCTVTRPWDKNSFSITGTLPVGQTLTESVPVQSPPLLAATLLQADLVRHGIAVLGIPLLGLTPPNVVTLASHPSLPLSEYIVRMNKPSDNLLAESLVRLLDGKGTYDAGHAQETPFFTKLGVD
ncbi:MAG: D-alanyl-D-alanine carboxypeptidase/D-alanyl-D-alanine endopeptidase, partial [Janthinobacterium lividum]